MQEENNEIILRINSRPISLHNSGSRVEIFKQLVLEELKEYDYVFTNELNIEITWFTLEQYKIFRSDSYDIDNIIKPLLDTIVSSGKILIDDSQVSSVLCSFIDSYDEYLEVRITPRAFDTKYYINDIDFVEFSSGYVFPISKKYYNKDLWGEIYFPNLVEYVKLSSIAYDLFILKQAQNEENYIMIKEMKLKNIGLTEIEELYDLLNKKQYSLPLVGKIYPKNKINSKLFNISKIEVYI